MVKGYKDTIMEYFNIIMTSLMVVLMVGVMMIVVQVSDNKAFMSFTEDVVSRYGAVTPEATEEINTYSLSKYGGKYTVVGGTETVQKYGEPIEFHIKGEFAVDFLGNEGTYGFKIPFINIDLKDVATSRVRTEEIDPTQYTYVVKFNDFNGSLINSQLVNYGEKPSLPSNPSRLGYTFKGWNLDILAPIYEDRTFVAQYQLNKYTVSFNFNGGSGSAPNQTVDHGSTVKAPTNPTRTGYTFAGWNPAIGSTITGNTNFVANWTINQYTLTINPNGGKFNGSTSTTTITNDYLVNSVFRKPTRTGYTFTGWTESGSGTITPYGTHIPTRTDSALENDSYWMDKISVYNNAGNGTVTRVNTTGTNPYNNSNRFMRITSSGTDQRPGRGGFIFSTTSSPNKEYYHVFVAKVPVGVTLRDARNAIGTGGSSTWLTSREGTGKMETYIYRVNSGSSGNFSTFGHVYAEGGSNNLVWDVYYSHVFEANGATIDNSELFAFNHAGNKRITAQWKINKYNVTFNSNGGTAVASQTVNYGSKATVPTNPTRTGYTFAGWSPAIGSTITGNTTFTAQWTINKYTVTFNSNGGTAVASQTVNYGSKASVPTNPTRTGYTFTGWSPAIGSTITGNTTFTAQWTINKYTVTFNSNGGTAVASQTVNYGSKASVPTNPTRTGYTFTGWSPAIGSTITGNTTFTAQWTINKYTVTFNSNGGTAVASQTVNYGSKATVPTNPTRTGYTFTGWSPAIGNPITGNTTFTAQWTAIPITTHSKTVTSTFSNDSRYTLTVKYTMKYQGSVLQIVDYEYYIRKSSGTGFYSHVLPNNYYKVTVAGRERASGNLEYDFRSSPKAGVYFNNTNTKKGTLSINSSSFTNNITVTVTLQNLGTATSSGNFNK